MRPETNPLFAGGSRLGAQGHSLIIGLKKGEGAAAAQLTRAPSLREGGVGLRTQGRGDLPPAHPGGRKAISWIYKPGDAPSSFKRSLKGFGWTKHEERS